MKYVVLFTVLLTLFTLSTAQADNEHIEMQLSPQIKLNVDICSEDIKNVRQFSMKRYHPECLSISSLTDHLFVHSDAQITQDGYYDGYSIYHQARHRINEAGEAAVIASDGLVQYYHSGKSTRYTMAEEYLFYERNFRAAEPSVKSLPFEDDDFLCSHTNFTAEEADLLAKQTIELILGESSVLSPCLLYRYSISYEQMELIMEAFRLYPEDWIETYHEAIAQRDWTEADNLYFFKYGFEIDGIPVVAVDDSKYVSSGESVIVPLAVDIKMNPEGIYNLYAMLASSECVSESFVGEPLSYDSACEALLAYFDSIIMTNPIEVTEMWLEYLVTANPSDYSLLDFTPVWRFNCDTIIGDVRFENDLMIRLHAITGEVVQ
ncbi:MAG: hypothetical protein E7337_00140 [Clostridiales bacterium]|nr:hypothetical protein [Clostridiales bacterium]